MKHSIRLSFIVAVVAIALFAAASPAQTLVTTIPVPEPLAVDVDPIAQLAFAANFGQPILSIISERTNSVVDTISFPPSPLGQAELDGVAVNPITRRLYVADTHATVLYVLDEHTHQVIATLPGISGQITVNLRTNKVYVTGIFSPVTIIDGNTNTVAGTLSVPFSLKAAVDLAANRIYIPSQNFFGDVFVFDGDTDAQIAKIPTGNFTSGVAVDPLHHRAYAANQGFSAATSSVSVIDTVTNTVIDTITSTDPFPTLVQVDPVTNRIFVINQVPNNGGVPTEIDTIDGTTLQVINRLNIDSTPEGSALDLVHGLLFVASSDFEAGVANEVTVVKVRQ